MNEFVDNQVRDSVIAKLLELPENKVSLTPTLIPTANQWICSNASTAKARIRSGAVRILECSCATSARASIEPWVSTSHLSGKLRHFVFTQDGMNEIHKESLGKESWVWKEKDVHRDWCYDRGLSWKITVEKHRCLETLISIELVIMQARTFFWTSFCKEHTIGVHTIFCQCESTLPF